MCMLAVDKNKHQFLAGFASSASKDDEVVNSALYPAPERGVRKYAVLSSPQQADITTEQSNNQENQK